MAKNRSATMPTKNGEIIAAIAVVPYGEPDLLRRRSAASGPARCPS